MLEMVRQKTVFINQLISNNFMRNLILDEEAEDEEEEYGNIDNYGEEDENEGKLIANFKLFE